MAGKCALFVTCPLRIFYEATRPGDDWMEAYCTGGYMKCARYKLEKAMGNIPGKKPSGKKVRK